MWEAASMGPVRFWWRWHQIKRDILASLRSGKLALSLPASQQNAHAVDAD
jgi:hypothetical protein